MGKKNYGLKFATNGRTVNIEYNEKMIKKAGGITVALDDTNTAHISMTDWEIGDYRRFKKLRRIFRKKCKCGQSCGIEVSGENTSIIFEGEKNGN